MRAGRLSALGGTGAPRAVRGDGTLDDAARSEHRARAGALLADMECVDPTGWLDVDGDAVWDTRSCA
jgi:hypothetical protein